MDFVSIWFKKILKGWKSSFHFATVNHSFSWILYFKYFDLVEVFHVSLNSEPLKISLGSKSLLTETQGGSGLRNSFITLTL